MSIMDLPERMRTEIARKGKDVHNKPDTRFSVTELLGCARKAYYRRTNPKEPSIEASWWMYRGDLLDRAFTHLFERSQQRVTYRIPRSDLMISGFFDFEDDGVICDLKTIADIRPVEKQPKREHVAQVMFYAYCEARHEGKIIYMSFKDAVVHRFDFEDDEAEEMLAGLSGKAKEINNSLNARMPPAKIMSRDDMWQCRYCEYADECGESPGESA